MQAPPPRFSNDLIDPTIAQQFTGQSTILDLPTARQNIDQCQSKATAASQALKHAKSVALYHRLRWFPVRCGLPAWVAALIAGSLEALLLTLICGLIFGVQPFWFFLIILFAYISFGGGAIWFLRDLAGEDDTNRFRLRRNALTAANTNCTAAQSALENQLARLHEAQQLLERLREAAQSELNRQTLASRRLLSIDPGRLYPDEFEQFVADVFTHLGFQVQKLAKTIDPAVHILAQRGDLKLAIQAKRYIGPVTHSTVQEAFTGMVNHQCNRCVVITTGDFTQTAITLAESTRSVLIDHQRIHALIRGRIQF